MGFWDFFFLPLFTGVAKVCKETRRADSGNLRIGSVKIC